MSKLVIGGIANPEDIEEFYRALEKEEKKFDKYIIAYRFLGNKTKMNTNGSYESLQILKFLLWGIQRTASYISSINEIDEFDIKIFS